MPTTAEKLKRDIEAIRETIRLTWIEIAHEEDAAKRAEMKKGIFEFYVPELKSALIQLETDPDAGRS